MSRTCHLALQKQYEQQGARGVVIVGLARASELNVLKAKMEYIDVAAALASEEDDLSGCLRPEGHVGRECGSMSISVGPN